MEKIDAKAINDLAKLLRENNLSELEYESGDTRIRLAADKVKQNAVVPVNSEEIANPVEVKVVQDKKKNYENAIKSPMVGILYLAPNVGSTNFVKEGDLVGVGQTLCLIEAMKTFNPIKSTKAGKVVKILVESGTPVEFNEPLFVVE